MSAEETQQKAQQGILPSAGTDFADALGMLARLPLSDAERADAVRRLISPPQP